MNGDNFVFRKDIHIKHEKELAMQNPNTFEAF